MAERPAPGPVFPASLWLVFRSHGCGAHGGGPPSPGGHVHRRSPARPAL